MDQFSVLSSQFSGNTTISIVVQRRIFGFNVEKTARKYGLARMLKQVVGHTGSRLS
jgi:RNA-splicing ligase RtcB